MGFDFKRKPGEKKEIFGELKNKHKVEISIVTPYWNGGKTLEETAISIFNQTYPFFEWIIVDDGTTEEFSIKELDKISKMDDRIKVFRKENEGPSVARDYGIHKADKKSKYILFLDCDDLMDKTMLECFYWALETHKEADFVYTSMINFGTREFLWEKYLTVEQQKVENLMCISSMIKKEVLLEVGCFGIKEMAMYEDWNLWLKMLAKGKKPLRINAPVFWYRLNTTGEFTRAQKNHEKAMALIKSTAATVKNDVEIIQFPRIGEKYPIVNKVEMELPKYKKNNKKVILFMMPWAVVGGADVFGLELIKRLDKTKYEVIVITTIPNKNPLRQEFELHAKEFYDLATFLDRKDYINFIEYLIESRNVDIVFNNASSYAYSMMPFIKNTFPKVLIIDYVHSIDLNDGKGGYGRYTFDFDNFIDATFSCNDFTTNQLINIYNKKNAKTIYIGTDHEKFNPKKYNKKELREKYGIPESGKVITYVGRLSEEKRPELLIDIANQLLKREKNLYFLIAGDGHLRNKVKDKISKYGIKNNVKMLGISKSEELFAITDVTINCSSLEGLALTSFESLAMEAPVVSANVGGQSELIDDTVGKIIKYDPNISKEEEINSYTKAVLEILHNSKKYRVNARKRILNAFTLDKMMKQFDVIFQTLKPKKTDGSSDCGLRIYEMYLQSLYNEYDWICREYYENKLGVVLDDSVELSEKEKIIKKFKNFAIKHGIKNEMSAFYKLFKSLYYLIFNIKEMLKNVLYFIFYIFKSLCACFKIFYRIIKIKK